MKPVSLGEALVELPVQNAKGLDDLRFRIREERETQLHPRAYGFRDRLQCVHAVIGNPHESNAKCFERILLLGQLTQLAFAGWSPMRGSVNDTEKSLGATQVIEATRLS